MVWLGLISILRGAPPTQGPTAPQRLSSEMAAAAARRRGRRCAQRPMRGAARAAAAAILTPLRADSVGFFSPGVKLTETGASSARFSLDSVLIKKYKHV